jgi:hypothetical protein
MAETSDPEAIKRLMALIMDRLGTPSSGALAVRLRRTVDHAHGEKTVRNWVKGEHGPECSSLMTMLSLAGLLTPEADAAWRGDEPSGGTMRLVPPSDQPPGNQRRSTG